jgi:hypothetical protein
LRSIVVFPVSVETSRISNSGMPQLSPRHSPYLRQALPEEWGIWRQTKFLLGHSSIQTTERYLGSDQEIAVAVGDNLWALIVMVLNPRRQARA